MFHIKTLSANADYNAVRKKIIETMQIITI